MLSLIVYNKVFFDFSLPTIVYHRTLLVQHSLGLGFIFIRLRCPNHLVKCSLSLSASSTLAHFYSTRWQLRLLVFCHTLSEPFPLPDIPVFNDQKLSLYHLTLYKVYFLVCQKAQPKFSLSVSGSDIIDGDRSLKRKITN